MNAQFSISTDINGTNYVTDIVDKVWLMIMD
jgi:hypothetical protein